MGNAWIQLVTKTYNDNKLKDGYTFKHAIKDAKKIYKKTGTVKNIVEKAVEKVINPREAHRIRDKGHANMTLQDFCDHPLAIRAKLSRAEVACLRMYTGLFLISFQLYKA